MLIAPLTALAVDTGNNGTVIPTITIEEHGTKDDAAKSTSAAGQVLDTGDEESVPGAMPDAPIRPIPDWYKMGWRAVGGIDDEPLTEQEEKDKGVLDAYLGEQYYGAWYHNAALIVVVSHPHSDPPPQGLRTDVLLCRPCLRHIS